VASVSVVASVEPNATIRGKLKHPTPIFGDLDEALAKVACDAVLITSAHASHVPLALKALSVGKHVLIEKPFAASVGEAKQVVDLAAARGLVVMVSQNYRRFPAPEAVAGLVARGDLGRLKSVFVRFDVRMEYADPNAGHYSHQEPLLEAVSIHHLDLMRFVTGCDPVAIACEKWMPPGSPYREPPAAIITAAFSDGVSVEYAGNVFSPEEKTPLSGRWAMRFEGGVCTWTSTGERDPTLADEKVIISRKDGSEEEISLERPGLYGRAALLADFARATQGTPPPRSCSLGRDNLMTLAMLEGAVLSARLNREIAIADLVSA
jgi:predicted dehydrogenase